MSSRKRSIDENIGDCKIVKKKRLSTKSSSSKSSSSKSSSSKSLNKSVNIVIPMHSLELNDIHNSSPDKEEENDLDLKCYTQSDVNEILQKQENAFRIIIEEKLKEQFNMFNQMYIDNIFKEYNCSNGDASYIN